MADLEWVTLGPGDYDRAKKVFDRAKHPGFIGRELYFRCATTGTATIATLDGADVGVALIAKHHRLLALSVVSKGGGIGTAMMRHLKPRWVSAIDEKKTWFARLGYVDEGPAKIGQGGKHSVQLMKLTDDSTIPEPVASVVSIKRVVETTPLPPLIEYIPQISPEFKPPYHMAEWLAIFDRIAKGEPVRALLTYPIRHYKTETTLHGVLWLLEHDPTLRMVIMTFSHERAMWLGKRLRVLAKRTKVGPTRGDDTITSWHNARGGGVVVMSADMSREGFDCHVLLVDDPLDEHGARQRDQRDMVDMQISNYTSRCMRAGKPGPVIIAASRFSRDDPTGRRLARQTVGWEHLSRPAIIDLGLETERAFAPDVWSLDQLKKMRAEQLEVDPYERIFWARFQGDPRVARADNFNEPVRYDYLPIMGGYRDGIGIDMSYSTGARSDWYAIVRIRIVAGTIHIKSCRRFKADPRDAEAELRTARDIDGAATPIYTYVSGPERIAIAHLAERGIAVNAMQAGQNKLWRAQKTIKIWRDGRIQWPPGNEAAIDRFKQFTGQEGGDDDEVDALVSVVDGMYFMGGATPHMVGERRFQR
jgi:hypothetical protein